MRPHVIVQLSDGTPTGQILSESFFIHGTRGQVVMFSFTRGSRRPAEAYFDAVFLVWRPTGASRFRPGCLTGRTVQSGGSRRLLK